MNSDDGCGYEMNSAGVPGWGMHAGALGTGGTSGGGAVGETSCNGTLPIVSGIVIQGCLADGTTASTSRMYSTVMISHDTSVGTVLGTLSLLPGCHIAILLGTIPLVSSTSVVWLESRLFTAR